MEQIISFGTNNGKAWFPNEKVEYGQDWTNPEFFSAWNNQDRPRRYQDYRLYGPSEKFFLPIDLRYAWIDGEDGTDGKRQNTNHIATSRFGDDVLNKIHQGQAKVLFISLTEGIITSETFKYIKSFVKLNELGVGEYYVLTSNLNRDSVPEEFCPFTRFVPYFFEDLWFKGGIGNFISPEEEIQRFLKENREVQKKYTFLQLSKHPRTVRSFMRAFMYCTPEVRKNTLLSFGNSYTGDKTLLGYILSDIKDKTRYEGESKRIQDYLSCCDLSEIILDCPDFDITNDWLNPVFLNRILYRTTFCNIDLETYYPFHLNDFAAEPIFFTEKTAKSLYTCQPFILLHHWGSLKKLHELGFQTFNRWWDEGYDLIQDAQDRLEAVIKLIREINTWSVEKQFIVTKEMEPVLEHNAYRLMEIARSGATFKYLEDIWNK